MGRLSIDNKKHNIRDISGNAQGWKHIFFGIGETFSTDCSWMVATRVTDIPFGFSLYVKFENKIK